MVEPCLIVSLFVWGFFNEKKRQWVDPRQHLNTYTAAHSLPIHNWDGGENRKK